MRECGTSDSDVGVPSPRPLSPPVPSRVFPGTQCAAAGLGTHWVRKVVSRGLVGASRLSCLDFFYNQCVATPLYAIPTRDCPGSGVSVRSPECPVWRAHVDVAARRRFFVIRITTESWHCYNHGNVEGERAGTPSNSLSSRQRKVCDLRDSLRTQVHALQFAVVFSASTKSTTSRPAHALGVASGILASIFTPRLARSTEIERKSRT